MNLKCETRHILRGGIERIIKSGGGEGLYLERADSDVRPVSSRTDRFPSPESLTRSKAGEQRNRDPQGAITSTKYSGAMEIVIRDIGFSQWMMEGAVQ